MAYDYAKIHLWFTLPPALVLHFAFRRIRSKRDTHLTLLLIFIAVTSTTPWDAYLIRTGIWSYPPNTSILGPTLFQIPLEEIFFFVVQTYITAQVYLISVKGVVHVRYLPTGREKRGWVWSFSTMIVLGGLGVYVWRYHMQEERCTYLRLIIGWTGPFLFFLWQITSTHLFALPTHTTFLPIILPTIYLWCVDTYALRRGVWAVSPGTKMGMELWSGLDFEEAIFFLLTNTMIVWGLVAGHKVLAIHDSFYPSPINSSPASYVRALAIAAGVHDMGERDDPMDVDDACQVLQAKSKSFFVASMLFEGRARLGLLKLYAFCRTADDLIDDAPSPSVASSHLDTLRSYLDAVYRHIDPAAPYTESPIVVLGEIPKSAKPALKLFPSVASLVPKGYFDLLMDGFERDALGCWPGSNTNPESGEGTPGSIGNRRVGVVNEEKESWIIKDEDDLMRYAQCVAGSVAGMCTCVLWPLPTPSFDPSTPTWTAGTPLPSLPLPLPSTKGQKQSLTASREVILAHAQSVGRALQLVNIARDVRADARTGRCYLPRTWLAEHGLTPADVLSLDLSQSHPLESKSEAKMKETNKAIRTVQRRLIHCALAMWDESSAALSYMPEDVRVGLRVAVVGYLEIGRVILERIGEEVEDDGRREVEERVSVGWTRRLGVAWRASGLS